MSNIQQDDKPWNLVTDRRAHRCSLPARRKLGRTHACDCGIVYRVERTRFGLQWMPQSDAAPAHSRSKRRTNPNH